MHVCWRRSDDDKCIVRGWMWAWPRPCRFLFTARCFTLACLIWIPHTTNMWPNGSSFLASAIWKLAFHLLPACIWLALCSRLNETSLTGSLVSEYYHVLIIEVIAFISWRHHKKEENENHLIDCQDYRLAWLPLSPFHSLQATQEICSSQGHRYDPSPNNPLAGTPIKPSECRTPPFCATPILLSVCTSSVGRSSVWPLFPYIPQSPCLQKELS